MPPSPLLPAILSLGCITATVAQGVQSPGHFGGFSSDGMVITVADDFRLEHAAQVIGLTWWGGYFNPPTGPDQFTIRLFSDAGGQPGTLLQELPLGRVSKEATGQFVNGAEGLYPEFQYGAGLDSPWTLDAGTTYWLSIVNPPRDAWLWSASSGRTDPGVQRRFGEEPWQPYFDNTAFALVLIPEPEGAVALGLALGLLGWHHRRRPRWNR